MAETVDETREAVLITGLFGSGKSSVAVEMADILEKRGVRYAVVDLDWLSWGWAGGDEEEGTLDIGYGLRPDLVGQGLGPSFVSEILRFGIDRFAPTRLRLLILTWNERSRKVAQKVSFRHEGIIASDEGEFLVMGRPAEDFEPAASTT